MEEAFERVKADFCVIVLPPYLHKQAIMLAVKKNMHILSEKPITDRYEDTIAVYKTVTKKPRYEKKYQAIIACVFLHKQGKLLVAKRSRSSKFLPGKYELIGGHIEFGEAIEEGLKREVREELHVDIEIGQPFYVFTYVSESGNKHSVEICYFANMLNPDQPIKLNPREHSEYRWIDADEVDIYFPPNDPEIVAAKKGFDEIMKDCR